MATHSGILACRIPRTEEPGRLQSMLLQEGWKIRSNRGGPEHVPHFPFQGPLLLFNAKGTSTNQSQEQNTQREDSGLSSSNFFDPIIIQKRTVPNYLWKG